MKWVRCTLCHRPFEIPTELNISVCERHNADGSLDVEYMEEVKEAKDNEVCFCKMSIAKAGHIHERGGYILCLHDAEEWARDCPAIELNDVEGVILHQY